MKKPADFTHTGNYLDTRITREHSDINKVLTNFTGIILVTRATKEQSSNNTALANCTGIILVTHRVFLSIAKNLAVSDFGDACTDLEIFRLSSR